MIQDTALWFRPTTRVDGDRRARKHNERQFGLRPALTLAGVGDDQAVDVDRVTGGRAVRRQGLPTIHESGEPGRGQCSAWQSGCGSPGAV